MAHDPETQKRLDDIMADPSYRLAYRDPDFIGSEDLRPLRLEMELLKPEMLMDCLLYTSPSPRDRTRSRMPSSA